MKKPMLIDEVSRRAGVSKDVARAAVDALQAAVTEALARGDAVFLAGLGKLEPRQRPEKTARDIRTGERVVVPARTVVVYRSSDAVERAVNRGRVARALSTGEG